MIPPFLSNTFILTGFLIQAYRILPENWLKSLKGKLPKIDVVIFIISLLMIGYGIYSELFTDKLIIIPSSRVVSAGANSVFFLKVINKNSFPLYDIPIDIKVEYGDLLVDNIKTLLITNKNRPIKNNTVVWDQALLSITYKEENIKFIRLFIYDIDGNISIDLKVFVKAKNNKYKSKIIFNLLEPLTVPPETGPGYRKIRFLKSNWQ